MTQFKSVERNQKSQGTILGRDGEIGVEDQRGQHRRRRRATGVSTEIKVQTQAQEKRQEVE